MKPLKIFCALLALTLSLCACKSTSAPELSKVTTRADLTHDGESDRIVSCVANADKGEAYVKVYTAGSGKKDVLIWKDTLGTEKRDYKGIYVCKKSGEFHLLVWKPTYEKDQTTLQYSVFYLQYSAETGKASPLNALNESITFTDEQVKKDGDKYDEASRFVYTLNKYLEKSAALVDTVDGEVVYSPSAKERTNKLYYPKWYDKDYKPSDNTSSSAPGSSKS